MIKLWFWRDICIYGSHTNDLKKDSKNTIDEESTQ